MLRMGQGRHTMIHTSLVCVLHYRGRECYTKLIEKTLHGMRTIIRQGTEWRIGSRVSWLGFSKKSIDKS